MIDVYVPEFVYQLFPYVAVVGGVLILALMSGPSMIGLGLVGVYVGTKAAISRGA